MRSKKDQELLRELVGLLLKYDAATIESCLDYIMENKRELENLLTFVNGQEFVGQRVQVKNEIDGALLAVEPEKSAIIKRIYRYLSNKRFTSAQIRALCQQYFKEGQLPVKLTPVRKSELLLELVKGLSNLPVKEVEEFEYYTQMNRRVESENTLENWSKVIIK